MRSSRPGGRGLIRDPCRGLSQTFSAGLSRASGSVPPWPTTRGGRRADQPSSGPCCRSPHVRLANFRHSLGAVGLGVWTTPAVEAVELIEPGLGPKRAPDHPGDGTSSDIRPPSGLAPGVPIRRISPRQPGRERRQPVGRCWRVVPGRLLSSRSATIPFARSNPGDWGGPRRSTLDPSSAVSSGRS